MRGFGKKQSGESGHAARNEGVNALYTAIDDINRIRNFRFDRAAKMAAAADFTR